MEHEVHEVVRATYTRLHAHITQLQSYLKLHHQDVEQRGLPATHLGTVQEVLGTTFGLLDSLNQYLQARQLRLRMSPVDLNRVWAEVRKELGCAATGREVQLTTTTLPTGLGDSKAMQISLQEYVLNALKFTRTREVACIHLRVQEIDGTYLIGVEDNGVGFNMRQKDKAFELFGRLHPGGTYEGTGLGLAVVRRLVEGMGGRAWGEGRVDHGATFWVTCPNWAAHPRGQLSAHCLRSCPRATRTQGGNETCLGAPLLVTATHQKSEGLRCQHMA